MSKKAKLIFIYGPPASGKFTIAKELSSFSNIPLFHNHLSFDLASSIYKVWSKKFYNYCEKLRLDGIKRALKQKKSLIFTFCYVDLYDLDFVKHIKKIVDKYDAKLCFVKLKVSQKILNKRVSLKDRSKYGKINNKKQLKEFKKTHNYFKTIPLEKSLKIDTEKSSVKTSVKSIIEYYKIK